MAGMEIHIQGNGTLDVSEGSTVDLTSEKFLLTAVIVGSQVEQNCFFEPANTTDQNEKEYLIYDKQIADEPVFLTTTLSNPVYTLGLQTKDDVSLKVVLEFENKSGAAFISDNGVIYPDTKFYMVASVVGQCGTPRHRRDRKTCHDPWPHDGGQPDGR